MVYSRAWGKLIHEKNQKQKISWHCHHLFPTHLSSYSNLVSLLIAPFHFSALHRSLIFVQSSSCCLTSKCFLSIAIKLTPISLLPNHLAPFHVFLWLTCSWPWPVMPSTLWTVCFSSLRQPPRPSASCTALPRNSANRKQQWDQILLQQKTAVRPNSSPCSAHKEILQQKTAVRPNSLSWQQWDQILRFVLHLREILQQYTVESPNSLLATAHPRNSATENSSETKFFVLFCTSKKLCTRKQLQVLIPCKLLHIHKTLESKTAVRPNSSSCSAPPRNSAIEISCKS